MVPNLDAVDIHEHFFSQFLHRNPYGNLTKSSMISAVCAGFEQSDQNLNDFNRLHKSPDLAVPKPGRADLPDPPFPRRLALP